jgi:hypothetical protein
MNDNIQHEEIIHVVFNSGEDKPWEITFPDISLLKRARAILNYPVHKFETEAKAVEVASMLRDIIKADGVQITGETEVHERKDENSFYHSVG